MFSAKVSDPSPRYRLKNATFPNETIATAASNERKRHLWWTNHFAIVSSGDRAVLAGRGAASFGGRSKTHLLAGRFSHTNIFSPGDLLSECGN